MNENIAAKLTDPQKNKEQFVHEMTEVYLLLENEFNQLPLSGINSDNEFDIPDMSAVHRKPFERSTITSSLAVPTSTSIKLSLKQIEQDKIETVNAELPVTQKFTSLSFPLTFSTEITNVSVNEMDISIHKGMTEHVIGAEIKTANTELPVAHKFTAPFFSLTVTTPKTEVSANVPNIAVQKRIPDCAVEELIPGFSDTDTRRFECSIQCITDINPKSIYVESRVDIQDAVNTQSKFSLDCELSPVICHTKKKGIQFTSNIENINIDAPSVGTYEDVSIELPAVQDVVMPSHGILSPITVKIAPEISIKVPVQGSLETGRTNNIDIGNISKIKADTSLEKTGVKKHLPVPIQIPSFDLSVNELNCIPKKEVEMHHIDFDNPTIGIERDTGIVSVKVDSAKLGFGTGTVGNDLNSMTVRKIVPFKIMVSSKIRTEEISAGLVDFNAAPASYIENKEIKFNTPLVEHKKIDQVFVPVGHAVNCAPLSSGVDVGSVSIELSAEKSGVHIDVINIPNTDITIDKQMESNTEVKIEGIIDVAEYIVESYESIKRMLSNQTSVSRKTTIDTASNQQDIDIRLPDINAYSQDILNSL